MYLIKSLLQCLINPVRQTNRNQFMSFSSAYSSIRAVTDGVVRLMFSLKYFSLCTL